MEMGRNREAKGRACFDQWSVAKCRQLESEHNSNATTHAPVSKKMHSLSVESNQLDQNAINVQKAK